MSKLPRVALIGRPNVGKSTLYNRLIGKRQAVVAAVSGTTRDRLEGLVQWDGRQFILVDMAGLEPSLSEDTEISRGTQAQVLRALADSEAIVWVVDIRAGVTLADQQVADMLQKLGKKVLIAANKADHAKHDIEQYEFSSFGFPAIVPVSALNGRGISDLLDAVKAEFVTTEAKEIENPKELKIAIIGRPNVGKSTLLNALTDDERSVVSSVPGTTRDSVDTIIPAEQLFKRTFTKWEQVRIIDTAGIRRRGKIEMGIESWSFLRTINAVEEAEVTLLMLDGTEGLTQQDLHIAQRILEIGRPVIILVNKWDAVLGAKGIISGTQEDEKKQEEFLDMLRVQASFLFWAQVLFLSAQEKINLHIISRLVLSAYNAWDLQVDQKDLDGLVEKLKFQPLFKALQKITMQHNKPPVFHLHIEGKNLPHFSTHRAAENVLREVFEIGPTPIKIWTETSIQKRPRK